MADMNTTLHGDGILRCKCERTHCICGYLEQIESLKQEVFGLRKVLKNVDDTIYDAMGEAGVPGKALISMRWARKLILLASGQPDADQ